MSALVVYALHALFGMSMLLTLLWLFVCAEEVKR